MHGYKWPINCTRTRTIVPEAAATAVPTNAADATAQTVGNGAGEEGAVDDTNLEGVAAASSPDQGLPLEPERESAAAPEEQAQQSPREYTGAFPDNP